MSIVSKAVGIDLGTTNSAVAVMDTADKNIIIHKDAKSKGQTTPSCVWKDPNNGQIVVGRFAFSRIGTAPKPIRSIKRSMGKSTTVWLTDEEVTPEKVSSYILGEMKRQIEEDVARFATASTQWIVDRAIVTVPAYFDQPGIDATRKAAELVGLQVLELLHEPTAAACYHCWRTKTQNGVFLVYDFGGGTFDVSVLRCTEGTFEVLGISGNNRLGGDDIDTALAEDLQERLLRDGYAFELDMKNNEEDRLRFDQLKYKAESIKKSLSSAFECHFSDQSLRDKAGKSVLIDTDFERAEVEELMRPIVERTLPYCFEALEIGNRRGNVTLADVDAIILAGGSTHIPLVREMVRNNLCADPSAQGPRAKCAEPVYENVDTIVALGAAIRAAATGGLAVYNPERTVRVTFRGTAATDTRDTYVGGKVETFAPGFDLKGGRIRLAISDLGFERDAELEVDGSFGFRRVPLQPSADNLLTFEVYGRNGDLLVTADRSVSQSKEPLGPDGGPVGTAKLTKGILVEVSHAGKPILKELIPSMTTLPIINKEFQFFHPGDTELIRIPVYQHTTKIQEIKVPVPSTLARGTLIEFNISVNKLAAIFIKGQIGETTFKCEMELPPERPLPTDEQVQALDLAFNEAIAFLAIGQRAFAEARYENAKKSYEAAARRGDREQAIHDFEEMEEVVASIQRPVTLQPPKESFDALVRECHDYHQYAVQVTTLAGHPYDSTEMAKNIETQRLEGEKAFKDGDQTRYSDAITMLEAMRDHIGGVIQKARMVTDGKGGKSDTGGTEVQDALALVKSAMTKALEVGQLAADQGRQDFQSEIEQIKQQLSRLERDVQQNPLGVQERARQHLARLAQIKNMLMSKTKPDGDDGKLPEDYSR